MSGKKPAPRVMQISRRLFTIGKHGSSMIKGIKVRGLCKRHLASAFAGVKEEEFKQVEQTTQGLVIRPALAILL